jgi:aminoglycoside 3-N-acetyltransferase
LASDTLVTKSSLISDIRKLGVGEGSTLLVHSSLRSLGWVCGGAVAVILALEEVLGEDGTLVMPAHSTELSDPSCWRNPPAPEGWWDVIRDEIPPFQPDLTPTWHIGTIPESFRKQDGTLRSSHPQVSFAARGRNAEFVTSNHSLNFPLGEGSPLARVYDLDGYVFLLGVNHLSNTSIHLAEYRADYPWKKVVKNGAPLLVDGKRQWVEIEDINGWMYDFDKIGNEFNATGHVARGPVGKADSLLMRQRTLVDFAVDWMRRNRREMPTFGKER